MNLKRISLATLTLLASCVDGIDPIGADIYRDETVDDRCVDGDECGPDVPSAALAVSDGVQEWPAVFDCEAAQGWYPDGRLVSSTVTDFHTGEPAGEASIEFFVDETQGVPFASTTANQEGAFTIALPAGSPVLVIARTISPSGDITDEWFGVGDQERFALSPPPEIVGDNRDTTALLIGQVLDCMFRPVAHATVRLMTRTSPNSDPEPVDAAVGYLRGEPGARVTLNQELVETNASGLFLAQGVPPLGELDVEVWGFRDSEAETLGNLDLVSVVTRSTAIRTTYLVTLVTTGGHSP